MVGALSIVSRGGWWWGAAVAFPPSTPFSYNQPFPSARCRGDPDGVSGGSPLRWSGCLSGCSPSSPVVGGGGVLLCLALAGCPRASLGFVCGSPCLPKSARRGLLAPTVTKALAGSGLQTFPDCWGRGGSVASLGSFSLLASSLLLSGRRGGWVCSAFHSDKFRKIKERRGAVAFLPGCFSLLPWLLWGLLPSGAWVVAVLNQTAGGPCGASGCR